MFQLFSMSSREKTRDCHGVSKNSGCSNRATSSCADALRAARAERSPPDLISCTPSANSKRPWSSDAVGIASRTCRCTWLIHGRACGSRNMHASLSMRMLSHPKSAGHSTSGKVPRSAMSTISRSARPTRGRRPARIKCSTRPSEKMSAFGEVLCCPPAKTSGAIHLTEPPNFRTLWVNKRLRPKSSNLALLRPGPVSTTMLDSLMSPWMMTGVCACR
mmetsp:Transcript_40686/g.112994  ORF Transcript_40686/g.112994 Transcript_40686/m.112994 type:complete len:218 (-) Transcript_40686:20-673(-)